MERHTFTIRDELATGLRRDHRNPRNTYSLTTCTNLKPSEWGLVPTEAIEMPWTYAELVSAGAITAEALEWPFPQLFLGESVTLLACKTKLFSIGANWALTEITTYDAQNMSSTKAIPTGGSWHFIDLGTTWLLFNGACTVFHSNLHNVTGYGYADKVLVHDGLTIKTGCQFRGRTVMGGFDSADTNPVWDSLPENVVLWSNIGGGDVFWPFLTELATQELKDIYLKRNEAGFMTMPWQGTIHCVKPLGKAVVVYGDNGIAALVPAAEPAPTFGLYEILDIGIESRGAIGGNDKNHVFLDTAGVLWHIDQKLTPQKIGYKEFFDDMLENTPVISHDPEENEFYICRGTEGYIYNKRGLGKLNQVVTAIIFLWGQLYGLTKDLASANVEIETDVFDLGLRNVKLIHNIEIGTTVTTDMLASIDYRFNKASDFQSTSWLPVRNDGTVVMLTSGVEFRVKVKAPKHEGLKIDYVRVNWEVAGRKSMKEVLGA